MEATIEGAVTGLRRGNHALWLGLLAGVVRLLDMGDPRAQRRR